MSSSNELVCARAQAFLCFAGQGLGAGGAQPVVAGRWGHAQGQGKERGERGAFSHYARRYNNMHLHEPMYSYVYMYVYKVYIKI